MGSEIESFDLACSLGMPLANRMRGCRLVVGHDGVYVVPDKTCAWGRDLCLSCTGTPSSWETFRLVPGSAHGVCSSGCFVW